MLVAFDLHVGATIRADRFVPRPSVDAAVLVGYPGSVASAWHHNFNRIVMSRKTGESRFEGNGIGLEWIEMDGPIYEQWPPASHEVLFGHTRMSRLPDTEEIIKARSERLRTQPRKRPNDLSWTEKLVKPLPPDPQNLLNARGFPQDGPVPNKPRDYTLAVPTPAAHARQLLQHFADRSCQQGAGLEPAIAALRSQLQPGPVKPPMPVQCRRDPL